MKITRKQLRRIIKEEISRLDESMSVDTMESLENAVKSGDREEIKRVLKVAYEEGMRSYSPDQRVIGIPGETEDRPVDSDPHTEVVNTLVSLVKSMLDDTPSGNPDDLEGEEALVLPNPYNQPRGAYHGDTTKLSAKQWIERQRRKVKKRKLKQ